jgi:hypothetical protein
MKTFMTVLALSLAAAVSSQAIAQTKPPAPTKVDCEKMKDKRWDEGSRTCLPK